MSVWLAWVGYVSFLALAGWAMPLACAGRRPPPPGAVAVSASVVRLRRVGPGSYRPVVAACSRTTSPAGSAGTCAQATPDSALAACTHLTVRSRFISAIRCTNSK